MNRMIGRTLAALVVLCPLVSAAQAGGTSLSADVPQPTLTCTGQGSAVVDIVAKLTSTAAVNAAQVTRAVTVVGDTTSSWVGEIRPQDFGRDKTAYFAEQLTLDNGSYQICYTFTQAGAGGRTTKQATDCTSFIVDCATEGNSCPSAGFFFGGIDQSPEICNATGKPHVPLHLKALATGSVSITVVGTTKNGEPFNFTDDMSHAGESCVYQYNWNPTGVDAGPGQYTFTATTADGVALATETVTWTCP